MSSIILARYVNPWKYRREQDEQRLRELRHRDGDDCRRCRRPMRFDLPDGHDLGARVEQIVTGAEEVDNLCLTHRRCIPEFADVTREVQDRVRRRSEADLFAKSRTRRRA